MRTCTIRGILWSVKDIEDAAIAAKRHDAAAVAYVAARSAYEDAVMGYAKEARQAAKARVDSAAAAYVETLAAVVTARKAAMPSFEALLADSTIQADPDSIVLASIVAHSNPKPATAARPAPSHSSHQHRTDRFNMGGWTKFSSETAAALTA